jgi:DNA invertase Pin-like site-specific DNA recombinase
MGETPTLRQNFAPYPRWLSNSPPLAVFRPKVKARSPLGVFAEFERAMIQERVRAGLARAEGKQLGRPKIEEKTECAVQTALRRKNRPGLRKIAAALGVGVGTVQRISRELATVL